MSTTWTEQDEATLRELTERKMRFTDEAKGPLRVLVKEFDMRPDPDYNNVVERLVARAADFRDALAPFDLRKPAPDPIEAAIQRGSFRFRYAGNHSICRIRKVGAGWRIEGNDAEPRPYGTDDIVRSLLRDGLWILVE